MKKSKANGNQKAKAKSRVRGNARNNGNAVAELCEMIEEATTPQGVFEGLCGGIACGDPYGVVYRCLEAARPEYVEYEKRYEGLVKKVDNSPEGHRFYLDIDQAVVARQTVEHDIFFLAGSLLGMRIAGRPLDEIRELADSIVAKGDR